MSETLLLFDRAMIGHDPGPNHPESPERLRAIEAALAQDRLLGSLPLESPPEATVEALTRVHTTTHVESLLALRNEEQAIDPDTFVGAGSIRAAMLAAGTATTAVDAVCTGDSASAFGFVRPPGHHAEGAKAMGFCLFNNAALAAAHARAAYGLDRVMVLDWDVHHGNGTQAIFYDDPSVLFCSLHQFPFYPGTGAAREVGQGAGAGFTVNVPLAAGATDSDYALAFDAVVTPIAEQFEPELVIVSAGFDAHRRDPLGGMMLSSEAFASFCGSAIEVAQRSADGKIVLLLEGGYDLEGLAQSAVACAKVLEGETPPVISRQTSPAAENAIAGVRAHQSKFWSV